MTGIPRWSVILPSYNGTDTLPECLAALVGLEGPPGGMEILLIDNASTDHTRAMLDAFASEHGARVLHEPRRGKSHALNRGIEESRGEMLVFLDDDCLAEPALLIRYAEAGRDYPDAGVLAGAIGPCWKVPPPDWLAGLAREGMACGCTPADRPGCWADAADVKGGNACIRRSCLGNARFSTGEVNYGAGGVAIGGEDTELFARLANNGARIRYVHDAMVGHIVDASEMTYGSLFKRNVRIGRGYAAIYKSKIPSNIKLLLKISAYYGFLFITFAILYFNKRLFADVVRKTGFMSGIMNYKMHELKILKDFVRK